MRLLAAAVVALASLSFVSLTAPPAQAVGICADESGHNGNPDLYNNMGDPSSDCDGIACVGYTGGTWQTCVPPTIYCTAGCTPPIEIATSASVGPALCLAGDLYNNQQPQPSSGCDGLACTGFSNGDWKTCVLDCTADGCPRLDRDL